MNICRSSGFAVLQFSTLTPAAIKPTYNTKYFFCMYHDDGCSTKLPNMWLMNGSKLLIT